MKRPLRMGSINFILLCLAGFFLRAAEPRVILPGADQKSLTWYYTTKIPNYGWHLPDFNPSTPFRGSVWEKGRAGFGNPESSDTQVGTAWSTPNIWLRRTFELGEEGLDRPHVRLRHDEHAEVYLNGYLAVKVAEGDGGSQLLPISHLARGTLRPGTNVIAVHGHQTTGAAYLDVGLVDVPAGGGAEPLVRTEDWVPRASSDPGEPWTAERARAWYAARLPIRGCNYVPRTAINSVEMWRAETFDPGTIDQELGWAARSGYNSVRVFLQYVVWEADPEAFARRFERFLSLADTHGITTMPVFFDDVCFAMKLEPILGPQDDPVPGIHNSGWVPSPGYSMVQDSSEWPALKAFVTDVVRRHRTDPRVLVWDIYNEPGPYFDSTRSFPLAKAAMGWARELNPIQPVTIGVWGNPQSRQFLELSDVLSLHTYGGGGLEAFFLDVQERYARPVLVTECLARPGFGFETMLPIFARYRAGWYNWGLVAGRTQTHRGWASEEGDPRPTLWHHDVLHPDGTPYDPRELELIKDFDFDERTPRILVPTSLREGQPWRWTTVQPANDWADPGFDDSAWVEGKGGFGHPDTPGDLARTAWVEQEIWLRRSFELDDRAIVEPHLRLQHDEDAEVYVNGRLAVRVKGYNAFYETFPLAPDAASSLRPGQNILAVHCRQTTGGQFIDVGIVADEVNSGSGH